jgi:SAM-dependent methyltransferase
MAMAETTEQTLERRLCDLRSFSRELNGKKPDLQAAFHDPEGADYWTWIQTHGFTDYMQVQDLSVPVPPPEVRRFVNPEPWGYLCCGASIYRMLTRVAADAGRKLEELGLVLDFGCGPGRGLRLFLRHASQIRCVGIDVDAVMIEWCRANFPFGEFHVNREQPPTDLPSSTFGLIYGISVFTHLSEANHFDWLAELGRLVRPSGLLVLTVHGRRALERALKDEAKLDLLSTPREDLDRVRSDLDLKGFAFVDQPGGHLNHDLYGITFVTEDYVRRRWSKDFEVTAYQSAALDDWQDVVVLRRRS